ncbi:hypothetical protein ALC56_06294 [Trachymyrmex septentrionalis]|uniref:Uncharacterized protein n=1 Tax=Trachymyrmex septentrionalis TaxID=34720 RepID=A0A195FG49_9HYME|nr:PREDICTED: uncharacterized protein LOC108748483 [Trachymyrmex septentrionalis]KYN39368.1 hypothetical protein ALC56_06294 [Trachymyrmex septentrionalis]
MWLHYSILIYLFGFLLAKSSKLFDDTGKYSSLLERKLTLKLKTATRLKHNVGKILYELPIQSYEMYHSVKIIEDYLKNGGSLLECLDVLPSITYAPIAEQIDSILGSMEDCLPKYLLPAISLIRRSLSEGVLDVDEIYKPTFGPPKADPLEKISVRELKEAASSLSYRASVRAIEEPWPKIVDETAMLIYDKVIPLRYELIAYILSNLRIPDATAEVRESIVLLVEHLQSHGKNELTYFNVSPDPYVLIANAVSSLSLQNEMLTAINVLLPFLRKPSECRESAEFASFFQNNTLMNYTLLISRDRMISKTKDGIAFLSMIQQNNTNVWDVIEQFSPFEYASWKDLLLAFVSQLRRQQNHRSKVSSIIDNVYGELILKNNRKCWQLPRNSIIASPLLFAIARKENSIRVRRLLMDVATDRTVKPEVWQKALAFISSEDISGPINATLQTLKALLISDLLPYSVLSMNIAELVTTFDNKFNQAQIECASRLETFLTNFTQETEISRKVTIGDIDVDDLLQALPKLDIYTDEYRTLKSFLSQDNLETKLGQIDLNAHPTRGRLLARLLQVIKRAGDIDGNLRRLAEQFADNVAYEGYGAGVLLYRSS